MCCSLGATRRQTPFLCPQDVPVADAKPEDIQDLLGGGLFKALFKWMVESGPVYLLPTGERLGPCDLWGCMHILCPGWMQVEAGQQRCSCSRWLYLLPMGEPAAVGCSLEAVLRVCALLVSKHPCIPAGDGQPPHT